MKFDAQELISDLGHLTNRLKYVAQHNFIPLSVAQLHWKPSAEKWSVAECMEHLNIANAFYLQEIIKRTQRLSAKQLTPRNVFSSGWLGDIMVKTVQLGDDNKPQRTFQTFSRFNPSQLLAAQNQEDPHKTIQTFIEDQNKIMDLLRAARKQNLQRIKIPSALTTLLRFRLGDVLRFVIYHNERHLVQAQRVCFLDDFPKK